MSETAVTDTVRMEDWMTQAASARFLGISRERVRQLVVERQLETRVLLGRKVVARQSVIARLMKRPKTRP